MAESPPSTRPSSAAYGSVRYGAVIGRKLMISARMKPPKRPTTIGTPTTAGLWLARNCDQGQSAAAISTSSDRNDLLIVPCSDMRSLSSAGRGSPLKVRSLRPGLPDLMLVSSFAMTESSSAKMGSNRRVFGAGHGGLGVAVLVALDQRVGVVVVNQLEILALHHVRGYE